MSSSHTLKHILSEDAEMQHSTKRQKLTTPPNTDPPSQDKNKLLQASTTTGTMADPVPQHKCSEYYHDSNKPCGEVRKCMGKHHTNPHYVCEECIKTHETWMYQGGVRWEDLVPLPALHTSRRIGLCSPCSDAAATRVESNPDASFGCKCPSGTDEPEWMCFECRDVLCFVGQQAYEDFVAIKDRTRAAIRADLELASPIMQSTTLCPGCEGLYTPRRASNHAHICMTCRGITLARRPEASTTTDARYPPLEGPNWSIAGMWDSPSRRRDLDTAQEEVDPLSQPLTPPSPSDESSPESYNLPEPASPPNAAGTTIPEWSFPRSSVVRTTPLPPPSDREDDILNIKADQAIFDYVSFTNSHCFICREEHFTLICPALGFEQLSEKDIIPGEEYPAGWILYEEAETERLKRLIYMKAGGDFDGEDTG